MTESAGQIAPHPRWQGRENACSVRGTPNALTTAMQSNTNHVTAEILFPQISDEDAREAGVARILVATSFSDLSEHALAHAVMLASQLGASIIVCHVCAPTPIIADTGVAIVPANIDAAGIQESAEASVMQDLAQFAATRVPMTAIIRQGDFATEIAEVAEQMHADLIVVGTHGRSGVMHMLLGDPAERLMRHTHIPVLVLHPRDD